MNRDMVPLSAEIQSDLIAWHEALARGGDQAIDRNPRLAVARAVQAVAQNRATCLLVLEACIKAADLGRPEVAARLLREAAACFRDLPIGKVVQ